MKKLIIAIALFLIIPITNAKADDNTPCFNGIRPHVGEIEDNTLVVQIPIIPLMGSTNFLQFGSLKTVFKNALNLQIPDEGSEFERVQGFLDTINNFHGQDTSLFLMVLPSLKVEVNTKYFEFKLLGGAKSYASAELKGLSRKLTTADIQVGENFQPYLTGVQQKVLNLKNVNLFGGEMWAIGKVPIKIKNYTLTALFGLGSAVAYRMSYSMTVDLEDTVTASSGFSSEFKQEHDILWNINAMAGLQFDGFKWLRARLVVQVRDIYNGFNKESKPLVDLGLEAQIANYATFRAEVYDMNDPQFRMEGSYKFMKSSEVAVGGMFNSHYPGKHYGYVSLGLGNQVIMWTVMALFNKDSIGGLTGLTLGWEGMIGKK